MSEARQGATDPPSEAATLPHVRGHACELCRAAGQASARAAARTCEGAAGASCRRESLHGMRAWALQDPYRAVLRGRDRVRDGSD